MIKQNIMKKLRNRIDKKYKKERKGITERIN